MESMLASPATAPLLTRERISPLYFFSYTFIPLSSIAFPHIGIFCLTARRLGTFPEDGRSSIPSACWRSGCRRSFSAWSPIVRSTCRRSGAKLEARPSWPPPVRRCRAERRDQLRAQAAGDDVILRLVEGYAPLWLAALLGAAVMAAVMASDSQILALSTMFTEDVFAFYGGTGAIRRRGAGSHRTDVRRAADDCRLRHRAAAHRSRSSISRRSTRSPATRRCRRCSSPRCSGRSSTKWGALAVHGVDGRGSCWRRRRCRSIVPPPPPGTAVPVLVDRRPRCRSRASPRARWCSACFRWCR